MTAAMTNHKKTMRSSPLSAKARDILKRNDQGGYTVPTEGMYPYQWNWDSAFVALGFAEFSVDRAIAELETLFEGQWDNGMVPHIIFRVDDPRYFPGPSVWRTGKSPQSSGITQPPVAASVVLKLWRMDLSEEQRLRLKKLFSKLVQSHRWFHEFRDPDQQGIVVMTHPWESGRDNSPEWDAPAANVDTSMVEQYQRRDLDHADAGMRPTKKDYDRFIALVQYGRDCDWNQAIIATKGPFRVADVGLSMMLLRANRDLLILADELNDFAASEEIARWVSLAERGKDLLWDERSETFCSRDLITGELSGHVTSASFLAIYAGAANDRQSAALMDHWDRIASRTTFMTPSFDPDHEEFDAKRYWRGPCWAVVNYMIACGFTENGFSEQADRTKSDTRKLIEQNSFYEAFSPLNGEGAGGRDFSWTAAMWLCWAGQE